MSNQLGHQLLLGTFDSICASIYGFMYQLMGKKEKNQQLFVFKKKKGLYHNKRLINI